MYRLLRTEEFDAWLRALRDPLLLCGGDKRSQARDIGEARRMAKNLEDQP